MEVIELREGSVLSDNGQTDAGLTVLFDHPGLMDHSTGYLANDINNNYFPNISQPTYKTPPASLNDINITVGTNTYSNSIATVQAITSASAMMRRWCATNASRSREGNAAMRLATGSAWNP